MLTEMKFITLPTPEYTEEVKRLKSKAEYCQVKIDEKPMQYGLVDKENSIVYLREGQKC